MSLMQRDSADAVQLLLTAVLQHSPQLCPTALAANELVQDAAAQLHCVVVASTSRGVPVGEEKGGGAHAFYLLRVILYYSGRPPELLT